MIGEFTSIFELAAGLNAAFVVVEYSKSFSKQLYKNAFKFDKHIDDEICSPQDLIDEETLKGLESVKCGEGETGKLIEKIRRDKEKLAKFINEERESLKVKAKQTCELRTHSGLSLLNFLFCLFVLLLSPLEKYHATFAQYLLISALLLIIIAQIICWAADAKDKKIQLFNSLTNSAIQTIVLFLIGVAMSLMAFRFLQKFSISWKLNDMLYLFLLYFCSILPFLNFGVFTIIFKKRLKGVQNEIKDSKDRVSKKCDEINVLANKVNTVSEVSHMLELTN